MRFGLYIITALQAIMTVVVLPCAIAQPTAVSNIVVIGDTGGDQSLLARKASGLSTLAGPDGLGISIGSLLGPTRIVEDDKGRRERLIAALGRVKSYLDYGAFTPIQVAAAAAINGPQECVDEMRATYQRRRDALVESFGRAGWDIPPPRASMFAWAPIPPAWRAVGSLEFSKRLLADAEVAVSPGNGFGEFGEGYVRIALVENRQRIRQAARNVKSFLAQAEPGEDATQNKATTS